jgi:hypothetical protein
MEPFSPTERTEVRRLPERARYDRETVHAILDEGLIAHIGFATGDHPFVIPTTYVRLDDVLYLHGSPASRMLRSLERGIPVCATVTLLDGLVLARSAFHHSMNYRSVVVIGKATEVKDPAEKLRVFDALVEHIVPGRSADARPANDFELQFTKLLALPLTEVSVKLRTGPPNDDEDDLALPIWAGVIPLALDPGAPIADAQAEGNVAAPAYATGYARCADGGNQRP